MDRKFYAMRIGLGLFIPAVCMGNGPAGRQETSAEADAGIPAETRKVYLSGTGEDRTVEWEFFCTAGRKSGFWTTIPVPSCWEQQGFGEYNYGGNHYSKLPEDAVPSEQGKYRYRFEVPGDWQKHLVRIVFEGSMTDTEVRINGQLAGPVHRGGFYRFAYDIGPLLNYGRQNLLEVNVSKESSDNSVNRAERRGDYWNFGGIFRPVFLEIKPALHIGRTAIDAGADGSFRADVYLGYPMPPACSLSIELRNGEGQTIGKPFGLPIPPGGDSLTVRNVCTGIRPWTAETPYLYTAEISLMWGDSLLHRTRERFGFRTFEIRAQEGFYLNGQRILLKGINRHSFRPESGRTLSPRLNYDDVRQIREMNMNAVRMSHYPPDPEFLDACDELGLYVLDELAGWQKSYDTAVGRKLVEEMVTRDVNHPCILFWDNGNERGWNAELDDEFSRWDPGKRPVLHPSDELNGVETRHYPTYGKVQECLRGEAIYFPTEFLHGLYDGGHGAGLHDYWETMRTHPRCGGGMLWDLADQGVMRTDRGDSLDTDGNHGADGILGPRREKEGSYFAVREIWSPVHIPWKILPEDFTGTIPVENRYDFINLDQCSFRWELGRFPDPAERTAGHRVLGSGWAPSPDLPPHRKGILELGFPGDWRKADVLYLTAMDPGDREIFTWSWGLSGRKVPLPAKKIPAKSVEIRNEGEMAVVTAGDLELVFDPDTWLLKHVMKGGRQISFGSGPRFVAARRGDRTPDGTTDPGSPKGSSLVYREIPLESRILEFELVRGGDSLVIESSWSGPLSTVRWTVSANGIVRLDYEYRYDGVVDLMGICFDFPEPEVKGIRWLGQGPYRVWQNRLHGTKLDVWENDYNDPVPAESFTYPEFKGYFRGWAWASLLTAQGTVHMADPSEDSYLGVYAPRDGRDALLYTLPQTGISVLSVIPAVRNKFQSTDVLGPASGARYVSGPVKGTLHFAFE